MCVPGCRETVLKRLNRRSFLKAATVAGAAAASGCAYEVRPAASTVATRTQRTFSQVIDLTHQLRTDFPTFMGKPQLEMKAVTTAAKDGYNTFEWTMLEHTGTHLDAPFHFSDKGYTSDKIPVSQLVAPLAVIDIRARAEGDAGAQLTPDDVKAYESEFGPVPEGVFF